MVFHNVFQLKNQGEAPNSTTRSLDYTPACREAGISKMITQISVIPQCISYPCNPSAIGVIRDFGIFPEISRGYLDNPRFDDYSLKKFIKKGGLFL
jgi:hypothetical protein